ncbi:Putative regulator of chromosome condensation 1/beta-lactamase-inhibitor protein II [Septoria linicola]|uniref:Regulator of chromosome condensation 1/beta-lactamase-inhibitor protein II n=1 Tax=Septoria linicola TaxID=215465 RepID=A0A9Q9ALY7_9PEZI|nr:putative regulator of chromosome condensation 1/beta-lactamase-inhibitor protein II [Septoria linicola]USW47231.1 Putative regulator of chromosome condensation 1/beta-lactamase-inhibitor protein II [Septoria linicola]
MSIHLWQAFYDDSIDAFERYLEAAAHHARPVHVSRAGPSYGMGAVIGSPDYASSPSASAKSKRANTPRTPAGGAVVLTKADINGRDSGGMTLLHHAASSNNENAVAFATALIEYPFIDLYVQDLENGWTALHRAFYFGNITIARLILERDSGNIFVSKQVNQLLKIKDREGLGPLDLYAATIKDRTLRPEETGRRRSASDASEEEAAGVDGDDDAIPAKIPFKAIGGDQLFAFGSGNNTNLGLGDQDDRAFPERVVLRRPEHLLRRFYKEHLKQDDLKWSMHDPTYHREPVDVRGLWIEDMPWVVRSRPLVIQDVFMSKLHSAVLTTDPVSNLYMCGHGQGGRLGTGDERTRFQYVCIEGGGLASKRTATVALGQNHTLALDDAGEIYSWGNNAYGQLGYGLPKVSGDEDPISTLPRQIFGPLKREAVLGIAASRIHSVAHTSTSLFTFGKNEGQLGIVDSDARSLEFQVTPRKVAASLFSSPIRAVAAIDRATICLLENHDVWVFANYGYAKIQFPLDGFTNYFLKQSFLVTTYDTAPNRIVKITAEGDTICAMSSRGEIFTISISQRSDDKTSVSTTNPAKIRSAISQPQRIWSPKKSNMAARDVGLDADGSIILSTDEGSVWKRTRRAKIKNTSAIAATEFRPKDYKFTRVPGLTRVLAVRASGSGAYSALRYDCDVLRKQIVVEDPSLWKNMFPLFSLSELAKCHAYSENSDDNTPRFWQASKKPDQLAAVKKAVLGSADIDTDLAHYFEHWSSETKHDALLATTTSDVRIPVHRFMLTARSRVLRRGFRDLCEATTFTIPDLCQSEIDDEGTLIVTFAGVDLLTLVDLAMYLYTDDLVPFWNFTRAAPKMAYSYRQVRTELMKISGKLEMRALELAVRQMVTPRPCLDMDLEVAYADPAFFYDADIIVELEDDEEVRLHSALVCARCPFFEGLFMGRSRGAWISGRAEAEHVKVDLKHVSASTFAMVLRHIYSDKGSELFDKVVAVDLDDFLDTVTDVLSCANELMLDRLSQIAQSVAGQHVNTRNVCGLLNTMAPSSVREFLDTGLEYLCLNLEAMLQGHHLNELDPDLLDELDDVVRENQLACMPFAKSGRAEMLLHERHPSLIDAIDRSRRRKLDGMVLRAKFQDLSSMGPGFFGEDLGTSPVQQKTRRRSSQLTKAEGMREQPPALRTRASAKDMMFDMDEEHDSRSARPSPAMRPMTNSVGLESNTPPQEAWLDSRGKALRSPKLAAQSPAQEAITPRTPKSPSMAVRAGKPWSSTLLSGKVDMKNILEQTASNRTSTLTQGLAGAASPPQDMPAPFSLPAPKMSQKERKRMQQAQQQGAASVSPALRAGIEPAKPFSWQTVSTQKRPMLKNVMDSEVTSTGESIGPRSNSTPQMTMRQTVANPRTAKTAIGPGALQARSATDSKQASPVIGPHNSTKPKSTPSQAPQPSHSRPIPQSISHQPIVEADWGLSMSEIVAQQQIEKDIIKEAVAKRDLQEIQAEQEFQQWWEKESARVQEAEQQANNAGPAKAAARKNRGRGVARSKGKKGGSEGGPKVVTAASPAAASNTPSARKQ